MQIFVAWPRRRTIARFRVGLFVDDVKAGAISPGETQQLTVDDTAKQLAARSWAGRSQPASLTRAVEGDTFRLSEMSPPLLMICLVVFAGLGVGDVIEGTFPGLRQYSLGSLIGLGLMMGPFTFLWWWPRYFRLELVDPASAASRVAA